MSDVAEVPFEDDALERARTVIFKQMAESIRLAHDINPNSWLVMRWKNQILLLVGAYYSFSPRSDMTGNVDLLLQDPIPDIGDLDEEEKDFKIHRDFHRVGIPAMEMAARFPILRESHHRAISTAARSKPNYWRLHDEHAMKEVEDFAGEMLPRPHYLDDPKFNEGVLDDVPWVVADRLASTIALAQRTNDRSWSFYKSQRSVVVTIADLPVAKWRQRPGRIELCVWLDDVPEPMARRWDEQRGEETVLDGEAGWFWARGYDIYDFIEDFAEAHERLVETVAQDVRTRIKTARKFDADLLSTLSGHAKEVLALPAYARAAGPEVNDDHGN
jgi:hypothetical protein